MIDNDVYVSLLQPSSSGEPDPDLATAIAFLRGDGVFELPEATSAAARSERRLRLLHELALATPITGSRKAACAVVADILSRHTADVPFALVYLFDVDGRAAWLGCATGQHSDLMGLEAKLVEAETVSFLEEVRRSGATVTLDDVGSCIGLQLSRRGPRHHRPCVVMPLRVPARPTPVGVLVVGISPGQVVDAACRVFCELLAHNVSSVIANALAPAERDLAIIKLQDDAMQMLFAIGLVASAAPAQSAVAALNQIGTLAKAGVDSLRDAASLLTRAER